MFLYKSNWQKDKTLEFDFEFVGSDTTKVELNIHMQDAAGRHITLKGGPLVVDLGFDAAKGMHLYEIEITGTSAIFRVDGKVLAELNASNMPGNTWYTGNLKGFADLWAVAPAQEAWAGDWNYNGTPLVAKIAGLGSPMDPLIIDPPVLPVEPTVPNPEDDMGDVILPETLSMVSQDPEMARFDWSFDDALTGISADAGIYLI